MKNSLELHTYLSQLFHFWLFVGGRRPYFHVVIEARRRQERRARIGLNRIDSALFITVEIVDDVSSFLVPQEYVSAIRTGHYILASLSEIIHALHCNQWEKFSISETYLIFIDVAEAIRRIME